MSAMPPWARLILLIFALPGIILLGLSILAVLVSILALLLLTVPVYRILSVVMSPSPGQFSPHDPEPTRMEPDFVSSPAGANPNRRHVEVKIIEPQ